MLYSMEIRDPNSQQSSFSTILLTQRVMEKQLSHSHVYERTVKKKEKKYDK